MARILSIICLLSTAVVGEANYYYAPLGPWGLEPSVIHAKAVGKTGDIDKVETISRKDKGKKDEIEEVKSDLGVNELEKAEEAFFRAVEEVEDAVVHAIDDEVETFFPHHKKPDECE